MREKRNIDHLQVGDAVDFWRITLLDPLHWMILVAEIKLPGHAALEFLLRKKNQEETELTILARFLPRSLGSICYRYVLACFHNWIFSSMLKKLESL